MKQSLSNIEENGSDTDSLIFPINVHESMQAASGLKKGEKTGIIISFWIFGNAILAWFLAGFLRTIVPNYYGWIVLLIIVTLQLTLGVYVLRLAMDERTLFREMTNADNSFANFFKIYKEVKSEDNATYPFDVIEFTDGSQAVYIQAKLGYNTQKLASNTYNANKEVESLICKSHMAYKKLYMNEKFSNSKAAQDLRAVSAGVQDEKLYGCYRSIVQHVLEIAEDESNTPCATYIIYAQTRMNKEELIPLVNNILNTFNSERTSYREVKVLPYDEIVELYRMYYNLEVLDMGVLRSKTANIKRNQCTIPVLKLYGASGKIYTTSEFSKMTQELLEEFGLE